MQLCEYSEFYNNYFKLAYSDLVSLIADKPQQITFEIENSHSHLMVYLSSNKNLDDKTKHKNLQKAHQHLVRATLDCYKILWVEISTFLDKLIKNENNELLSFNISESQVLIAWNSFKQKANKARQNEMQNIGVEHKKTIELYKEAIDSGKFLFDKFDANKSTAIKKINFVNLIKTHSIGFGVGVASSALVAFFMSAN